jgi:hypothetical protein
MAGAAKITIAEVEELCLWRIRMKQNSHSWNHGFNVFSRRNV